MQKERRARKDLIDFLSYWRHSLPPAQHDYHNRLRRVETAEILRQFATPELEVDYYLERTEQIDKEYQALLAKGHVKGDPEIRDNRKQLSRQRFRLKLAESGLSKVKNQKASSDSSSHDTSVLNDKHQVQDKVCRVAEAPDSAGKACLS